MAKSNVELAIKDIDAKVAELLEAKQALVKVAGTLGTKGTRVVSQETRDKIAAAQAKRWAKTKKGTKTTKKAVETVEK